MVFHQEAINQNVVWLVHGLSCEPNGRRPRRNPSPRAVFARAGFSSGRQR
jgi:hypothetical protein